MGDTLALSGKTSKQLFLNGYEKCLKSYHQKVCYSMAKFLKNAEKWVVRLSTSRPSVKCASKENKKFYKFL